MRNLKRTVVTGPWEAGNLSNQLIAGSKWFEVTPLPDDEFEFRIKNESAPARYTWEVITA